MPECLIGLGSNVGDRASMLDQAVRKLGTSPRVQTRSASRHHETAPVGGPAGQDPFLNAALRVSTEMSPRQLLAWTRRVERELGRERSERWGPRVIDIDVLLYEQLVWESHDLWIPHPRMAVRRFVLEPACEIAADMVHPLTGWSLARLLARLDEPLCYVAIAGLDSAARAQLARRASSRTRAQLIGGDPPTAAHQRASPISLEAELASVLDVMAWQERLLVATAAAGEHAVVVSDFWLNQYAALARTWPRGPEREILERTCGKALQRVPLPRFVLLLDATLAGGNDRGGAGSGRSPQSAGSTQSAATLAQELRRQARLSGQGPVLRVCADDLAAAEQELVAGMDAMRSSGEN